MRRIDPVQWNPRIQCSSVLKCSVLRGQGLESGYEHMYPGSGVAVGSRCRSFLRPAQPQERAGLRSPHRLLLSNTQVVSYFQTHNHIFNGLTGARARLGVREHTAHALTGLRLHDDTSRHVPRLLPISTRFLRLLAHAH